MAKTETQRTQTLDLDALRGRLEAERREITDRYRQDVRAGQEAADEGADDIVDRANNSYSRELMFSLSDNERKNLLQVDAALERMEAGTYGHCINCGRQIGTPRLEAIPWARYCVDCQDLAEQGLLKEDEN